MYQCDNVLKYQCTIYQYTNVLVPMYQYTSVPMYQYDNVIKYQCTIYQYVNVQICPMFHYVTNMLLYDNSVGSGFNTCVRQLSKSVI